MRMLTRLQINVGFPVPGLGQYRVTATIETNLRKKPISTLVFLGCCRNLPQTLSIWRESYLIREQVEPRTSERKSEMCS
jgi:hypothetical protein